MKDREEYISILEQENAELKKQLQIKENGFKASTDELCKYAIENEKLKKQLEERPKEYVFIGNDQNKTRDFINRITKDNKEYKTQQQAFIKFLEGEINKTDYEVNILGNYPYLAWSNACKKNLQKYKEIIGIEENGQ